MILKSVKDMVSVVTGIMSFCFGGFVLKFWMICHEMHYFLSEWNSLRHVWSKMNERKHFGRHLWMEAHARIIIVLRKGRFPKKNKKTGGFILMQARNKIRVVIADRDLFYLQKLKLCLERRGDMVVVGMADNGPAVFRMIQENAPDVVLMDVILGEKDGVWVLEQMKEWKKQCVCVMISAIDSDTVVRRAVAMGADYYMAKPIQGELLLERIRQLTEPIRPYGSKEKLWMPQSEEAITERQRLSGLEVEISSLLSRMGVPASIKGYHFIRQAVMMAVEDPEVMIGITKGLYPDIARMYHTSASKVERAIRHAVESAWKKNGRQVYFEISGYHMVEKPTNGQFIAILAEYFRMRHGQPYQLVSYEKDGVKTSTDIHGEEKMLLFS